MVGKKEMMRRRAADALELERDFSENDGKVYSNRDAVIDGYVRMCRAKERYVVSDHMTILPDYYPVADGTDRYVIGFTLYLGKAELGKLRNVYTDDVSLTLDLEDMCMTIRNASIGDGRKDGDEVRGSA